MTARQIEAHDDQRDLGADGLASLVAAYRELFGGASRLLDAGGGSGVAVPALRAVARTVVLLDWSTTMLAAARGNGALRCAGDLRQLPFPDGSFDGVHAAYALQNVSDWRSAVAECARVARPQAPVVVAWGGPAPDQRLADLEAAYFAVTGPAAGVRAERTGLTIDGASDLFAALGRPLRSTVRVDGTQRRTPRQVVERLALNPYRATPSEVQRESAVVAALAWAEQHLGPVDEPLRFRVAKVHHVYAAA